jgi:type 1 glutamine amidotransferase
VGIRTASHAFASRDGKIPEGREAWPEFDRDILGGNYHNHHGNKNQDDPKTYVRPLKEASGHPILKGVRRDEFVVPSWLYKVVPLAETATPLLMGRVGERLPHQPVAWTNLPKTGNRVFYTSLGHPEDFEIPDFRRLLVNGMVWALGERAASERAKAVGTRN